MQERICAGEPHSHHILHELSNRLDPGDRSRWVIKDTKRGGKFESEARHVYNLKENQNHWNVEVTVQRKDRTEVSGELKKKMHPLRCREKEMGGLSGYWLWRSAVDVFMRL